jgi:NodT family efflux transporter outer membrane factor (OMF) lipoprotein
MHSRTLAVTAAAVFTLTLAACVSAPQESPHAQPLASPALGLTGAAVDRVAADWWVSFQDPQLDRLIDEGLKDSPTLAQAQARVAEAAAQVQYAGSKLLPNAKLDAGAFYAHAPENFLFPPPYAGHGFWLGQAGTTLNWDLDFFGREQHALDSARALGQSAHFDAENARLMLAGAIVQAYVELYREDALADIAARSESQRANIVDITRRRVAAGLDTKLELREAEGQLPQARVARAQAQAAAMRAVHELAALTGQGADAHASVMRPTLKLDAALPVPTALPLNLLARRPDILSARLLVQAADAERLSDKAAFYPDVSLQAVAGFGAFGLHNLVQWNARGAGAGPMLSLPLFDGGRLRAQYRGSEARLDSAVDGYNDAVLAAIRQAADQLSDLSALASERVDQEKTVEASEAAYKLAEERYQAGLASYLLVLSAETQVLTARQNIVNIEASQALARVALLIAVGGSFEPTSTTPDPS